MKYSVEVDTVKKFDAWAGGKIVLDELAGDALDAVECFFDDAAVWDGCGASVPTETEVNDWLWFECEDYLAECGLKLDGTPIED